MKELDRANDLMGEGKRLEADVLLKRILERAGTKKGIYEDAINIYLLGSMRREAREVFELYKRRTGRELTVEVTFEELKQEEVAAQRQQAELDASPVKVFRGRTFRERDCMLGSIGWGNLYGLLSPITAVEIHEGQVVLKKKSHQYALRWSEITDVSLTMTLPKYPGHWRDYPEKSLILKAGRRTFCLDVSDQNPAFEASEVLISELEKRLALRKIVKRPTLYLGFPLEWWLTLAFLMGLIVWQMTNH